MRKNSFNYFLINLIDLYDEIIDFIFDKIFSIETRKQLDAYDLLPENSRNIESAKKYQATRVRVILRAMDLIGNYAKLDKFTFVDVGCGKGRLALFSLQAGFNNYSGIDFSPTLIHQATENFHKKSIYSKVEFICSDILEIDFSDRPTVFFLYNPFDGKVLKPFIEKIKIRKSETYVI